MSPSLWDVDRLHGRIAISDVKGLKVFVQARSSVSMNEINLDIAHIPSPSTWSQPASRYSTLAQLENFSAMRWLSPF